MGDHALRVMQELPVLSEPVCPAAFPIRGATDWDQGAVCRLMQEDAEDDPGVGMTAGALGVIRESHGGVYLSLKTDPGSVLGFCYGEAVGRSSEADAGPRAHFTFCPVFEAWWERQHAGLEGLYDLAEPEPVSMGVEEVEAASTFDADDPWAAARAGLDELAPKKAA